MSVRNAIKSKDKKILKSVPLNESLLEIAKLKSKELKVTHTEILRAGITFAFENDEFWLLMKDVCK